MFRMFAGFALGASALILGSLLTTGYGQEAETEPTLAERVTQLERELASLETRFEARTTGEPDAPPERTRGVPLDTRINELERRVARLETDLNRVERQASAALRQAMRAQREAATARRIARQARMPATP